MPGTATTSVSTATKSSKGTSKKTNEEREVLYPKPITDWRLDDNPWTEEDAMDFLGWTEVDPKKSEYHIVDRFDKYILFTKNCANRPVYQSNMEDIVQSILGKDLNGVRTWKTNGETFIVSKYGDVIQGAHTNGALILANQDLRIDRDQHEGAKYGKLWPDASVSITKLVVYGIDDDDDTVNTIDTAKARSMMDVIYRSGFFKRMKSLSARKIVSKIAEQAIGELWKRTGVDANMKLRHTKLASIQFLLNHPTLVECVEHIYKAYTAKEVDWKATNKVMGAGYAAALMYLMATSKSDGRRYRTASPPREGSGKGASRFVDFGNMEKAKEFWTNFATKTNRFGCIHDAIEHCIKYGNDGTKIERFGVIFRAWKAFEAGKQLRSDGVMLKPDEHYSENTIGAIQVCTFKPSFGGIDCGPQGKPAPDADPVVIKQPKSTAELNGKGEPKADGKDKGDKKDSGKGKGKGSGKGKGKAKSKPKAGGEEIELDDEGRPVFDDPLDGFEEDEDDDTGEEFNFDDSEGDEDDD